MLFNSLEFFFFFPVVTLLYFLLPQPYRWMHLLLSSCLFYAAFVPAYLSILFLTIIIDYVAGIRIAGSTGAARKVYLTGSIIANIGVLAVFKYYNFGIQNINALLAFSGTDTRLPLWDILLPIGLSFHTFQAMSYTIEVYRGHQNPERHFGIYALYVMFYPQLVAGPIERPQNILHQFYEKHHFDPVMFVSGMRLMAWGLFKKVVVADRLAIYANAVFENPDEYHWLNLVIGVFAFGIQIYGDFSGYSDMAIGAARTMGYRLMVNFNRPYQALNIHEFWSRWHISLSTWFRDYLYIPMGGNRLGYPAQLRNVVIVFLVSGLWHGAAWTFAIWGGLHAIYIVIYNLSKKFLPSLPSTSFIRFSSWLLNLFAVMLAWIFFRANSMESAMMMIKSIFTLNDLHAFSTVVSVNQFMEFGPSSAIISVAMCFITFLCERKFDPMLSGFNNRAKTDMLFLSGVLLMILLFGVFNNSSFIYFQF
jgi:D-alanyl-lipoteichoic acid acyltransferase DltB (MBOAT superfamily)